MPPFRSGFKVKGVHGCYQRGIKQASCNGPIHCRGRRSDHRQRFKLWLEENWLAMVLRCSGSRDGRNIFS